MLKELITAVFIFILFAANSQKYSFSTYSTEQGLPQSQVTSFSQDEEGYLWVGTLGGLAKFNGDKFVTYSVNEGLLNNRIHSLVFFNNKLWVGHDGGISIISNGKIEQVPFTGNDRSRRVSQIIEFNTKLFVCSNGGGLFEYKEGRLIKRSLDLDGADRIRSACTYNGKMYLASKGGVLATSDGDSFYKLESLGDFSFSGISQLGENELVFSSYTDGVFIMNMELNTIHTVSSSDLKHRISGVYVDSEKTIWLKTFNGIVKVLNKNEISFIDDSNGLPVNSISCFYEDSDKTIWIGSQGKGMFTFPSEDFKYYDRSTGLPSDLYISGFQTGTKDFYFGSYDKGVVKKRVDGSIEVINTGGTRIWSAMHEVSGSDWFGTDVSLVELKKDGSTKIYQHGEEGIPGMKITTLYKISNHSFLIGGNRGAAKYENGHFKQLGTSEDIGTVRDFEVIDGVLYCATNLGLMVYQNNEFEFVNGGEQLVYNLEKDKDNVLWIGTEEGLFRKRENRIEKIELLNDPGSNYIDFLNHRNGEMYVGTNNGLFVLSELSNRKPKVERFGIHEGIVDLETNLNSGFFDSEGGFWFGTASALVCYHRQKKKGKAIRPRVNIASILVNYSEFEYSKYSEDIDEKGFPKSLLLPYSKNNLIFNLDGISLDQHGGLNYQFLLEGQHDEWSISSKNNSVSFNNLKAGSYVLRLRCFDNDGTLSNEINFPFIVKDAFYNTWWFLMIIFVFVGSIVWLIFKFRFRRIERINKQEMIEYKSKLLELEQQSMNASMNRHFIFNSLNSIQYFINTQDRLSANKYLTNFAKLIRKNLDSATAVNNMISLEDELERVQLYLSLESMRFKDRFEYNITIENVDTESIMIPAMIMQPFVENSIIHGILIDESSKGKIDISLKMSEDFLCIEINDNGVGISKSLAKKHGNTGDHKSQGMEITSKRIEILQKITKNGISLDGPMDIVGNDGSINGTAVLIKIPHKHLDN